MPHVGFGVGPDAGLGVDLVPRFHPRTDRVGSRFGYVQPMAFADRSFEFLLDLGLRLAQHVLDDPLSALRVIARRVPALPASVLSLSDVPFSVCSPFRHGISPFRNEQYRNQEGKAIGKPDCYQKVIICPSEPRRLSLPIAAQFLRCQGTFFFGYSGAIFERPIPFLLTTAAQNMHDLRRKSPLQKITFSGS